MTDKPTPTTDLLKRCAEIHEWRSTGLLSGEALRDYAKRKWPDLHDTLQMAEHETVTEALALLAKWGQPAQAGEPVAWRVHPYDYGIGYEGVYAMTMREDQREAWRLASIENLRAAMNSYGIRAFGKGSCTTEIDRVNGSVTILRVADMQDSTVTKIVDGRRFWARSADECAGCAAESDTDLCNALGACTAPPIVWVELAPAVARLTTPEIDTLKQQAIDQYGATWLHEFGSFVELSLIHI